MIFCMELLPGAKISEVQIAKKLNLSRTPIHDALRQLSAQGLVTIVANRGASVADFTPAEIKAIGTIRLSQDLLAAQLLSYYGCAADFEYLEQLAEQCAQASAQGDVYSRIKLDIAFHLAIARLSKNALLLEEQTAIFQRVHLIQISKYTDVEQSLLQIHHHKPLIEAMRQGDLKQIRHLVYEHIAHFYEIDPYLSKCYDTAF